MNCKTLGRKGVPTPYSDDTDRVLVSKEERGTSVVKVSPPSLSPYIRSFQEEVREPSRTRGTPLVPTRSSTLTRFRYSVYLGSNLVSKGGVTVKTHVQSPINKDGVFITMTRQEYSTTLLVYSLTKFLQLIPKPCLRGESYGHSLKS